MSNVSLERYYFVLYDGALTLKMSKMALNAFCDKTLHILCIIFFVCYVYALRFEHLHWVDIAHYKNSLLLLLL